MGRLSPLVENKKDSQHHAGETRRIIPAQLLPQIKYGKYRKDSQRDEFLNRLQLRRGKLIGPDAIRRHLKAILEECDPPADKNDLPQRLAPVFQVSVPRKRHENVGNRQQQDGSHASSSLSPLQVVFGKARYRTAERVRLGASV